MDRRRRTEPAARAHVTLTERDGFVLLALAECGYLSAAQISRECFPSADRCRRRLRQLLDAKYITAFLCASRDSNILAIGRDGLLALRDLGHDITGLTTPAPLRASAARHTLLISDMRLWAARLNEAGLGQLYAWEPGRGEYARQLGLAQHHLAPDALCVASVQGHEITAVIEADCGHETQALTLKLRALKGWLATRRDTELWLVVIGDDVRIRQIRTMISEAGVGRWTRLFRQEEVISRPLGDPPGLVERP